MLKDNTNNMFCFEGLREARTGYVRYKHAEHLGVSSVVPMKLKGSHPSCVSGNHLSNMEVDRKLCSRKIEHTI